MITPDTPLSQILDDEVLGRFSGYFIFDRDGNWERKLRESFSTLREIENVYPSWNAGDMAYGLEAFRAQGERREYPVYTNSEVSLSPDKTDVKLFHFRPDEKKRQKKTVIIAPGGAYGAVCSLVEGFPVAAAFAEAGVDAFCLNYRVGAPFPLFPKPMDDMAAAVSFLMKHSEEIGINMDDYALVGFSAGGHLSSIFATKERGWLHYGLPRPSLVILNYPMTDIWNNLEGIGEPVRTMMLRGYFGDDFSKETVDSYSPFTLCDGDYPPLFVRHAEDDTTVPVAFTDTFVRILEEKGVRVDFLKAENGMHGYGLGTFSGASGWVGSALTFWNSLK